jgi:hypothetical protein
VSLDERDTEYGTIRLMTKVPLARRFNQCVSLLLVVGLLASLVIFFGWVAVSEMLIGHFPGVALLATVAFAVVALPIAAALSRATRVVPHLLLGEDT